MAGTEWTNVEDDCFSGTKEFEQKYYNALYVPSRKIMFGFLDGHLRTELEFGNVGFCGERRTRAHGGKRREFQYKILNRILYTNEMLFRFKKVNSPLCVFCENELETAEHLFFFCTKVGIFWDDLKAVLNSLNISVDLEIKDILFGILDTSNINILVNYIVLESKYFIYRCKLNKGSLSLRLLVDKFRKTFQTERFVARKNDKLDFHDKKWKPLLPLIQQ